MVLAWLAIILLIAAGLRIGLARMVIAQQTAATMGEVHGDTVGYLRLGEKMYEGRPYEEGRALYRNRALIRPPGYPAFYAGVRWAYSLVGIDLGKDLRPIVWPQVAVSLAQVAATFGLALVVLKRLSAAVVAGLIAALSPTGIATSSIVMADSPFAACFAIGFVGFVMAGLGRTRPAVTSLAGGSLALAALLKPAAIYFPLVAVPALLILRGVRWEVVADLRRLLLPLLIVITTWTGFNYWSQGVAAYSIVAARNMRYDVVPKVELVGKLHRMPTLAEYTKHAGKVVAADDKYLRQNDASPAVVYERITAETARILRRKPLRSARVYISNLRTQLTSRYKLIHRQLRRRDADSARIRQIVESTDGPVPLTLWFGSMLISLPLWFGERRTRVALSLCWLGFFYIALPLGSVTNEGSRLMLAAEPMAATLVVGGIFGIAIVARRWMRRPVVSTGEVIPT